MVDQTGMNRFSNDSGISMLELVVYILMVGILGSVAVPNISAMNGSIHRMNARFQVLQDLRQAQAMTVTHGCRGIFKVINSGAAYSYGCDYLTYDTTSPPSADLVFFTRYLPNGFLLSVSSPVIFSSRGNLIDLNNDITTVAVTVTDTLYSSPSAVIGAGTIYGTGVFEYS